MAVPSYEERLVAFVDILGFKDLVRRSIPPREEISVSALREALKPSAPIGEEQIVLGRVGDISKCGHRMTHFSDCVLISTEPTEVGPLNLVHHVGMIGFRLLRMGFLCRGGIVQGLISHDANAVLGPAVIEAYEMERDALYPRVVIAENLVKRGLSYEEPVNRIFRRFIYRDEDGRYVVHLLRVFSLLDDPTSLQPLIGGIRNSLGKELSRLATNRQTREAEKVSWFLRYFDRITVRPDLNVPFPKAQ